MIKVTSPRQLELLAPARNAEIAIAAIDHGADAVYMGAAHHGARHQAGNSLEDISKVVEYAHRFNVRVYVTLNTLIYDDEIKSVRQLVWQLYRAGVDALIVQDMALLEMQLPPIALHASTQCDICTPERARFLQNVGFSQLVLARELTLDEIKAIRDVTTVPLEAFVHGALCVSYSGNCQASYMITGRSANRGECAQMCRLPYDLIDGNGSTVISGAHLLSLNDMNRLSQLEPMIEAGISSFKIEGRLKDVEYVKTVVAAYRRELDAIINMHRDKYCRSSLGNITFSFKPVLEESFNRGYTDYFLTRRQPQGTMASFDTPKKMGLKVGTVISCNNKTITVKSSDTFNNGDGFTYKTPDGQLRGFRINRAEGNKLILNTPISIKPGTTLYRNFNSAYSTIMRQTTATRHIPVEMTLRHATTNIIALDISLVDNQKITATATVALNQLTEAQKPQTQTRLATLGKLGDTVYTLTTLHDLAGNLFIPLSLLSALRRDAIAALDTARKASYTYDYRRATTCKSPLLAGQELKYSDNVANRLAREFYTRQGVHSIEPALEVERKPSGTPTRVMLTRYCLRRELGRCLKTPAGRQLQGPLKLKGSNFTLDLEFDCRQCQMAVYTTPRQ